MKFMKKTLAMILALLCAFSVMSTMASATAPTLKVQKIEGRTVTISPVSNCIYGWKAYDAAGDPIYGSSNVIELTGGSTAGYSIYIKNSDGENTTVIKEAPPKPEKPEFLACSSDSITVVGKADTLYMCTCEGETVVNWQESDTLSGLHKDKMYTIYAKGKSADDQLEGEISEGLVVRTAHNNAYTDARIDDCYVVVPVRTVKKGIDVPFEATGAFRTVNDENTITYVSGDTRFIPVSWSAYQDGKKDPFASGTFDKVKFVQKKNINTDAVEVSQGGNAVNVKVYVYFQKQVFNNGTWHNQGKALERHCDFSVEPELTTWEKFEQVLSNILMAISNGLFWLWNTVMEWLSGTDLLAK